MNQESLHASAASGWTVVSCSECAKVTRLPVVTCPHCGAPFEKPVEGERG